LPVSGIIRGGTRRRLLPGELVAYDAPYPEERYKAGARKFPQLVPVTPEHAQVAENKAAWQVLGTFHKPLLTAFSDGDPVTRGAEKPFQQLIPGAQGQPHVTIKDASHFLQEDKPEELTALIADFIQRTFA
jgi:haloalkane dehalogenase